MAQALRRVPVPVKKEGRARRSKVGAAAACAGPEVSQGVSDKAPGRFGCGIVFVPTSGGGDGRTGRNLPHPDDRHGLFLEQRDLRVNIKLYPIEPFQL